MWRANHYVWVAWVDWWRWPTWRNEQRLDIAEDYARRVEASRP